MRFRFVLPLLLFAGVTSTSAGERLRLSTTTSTEASGLLGAILPAFEERTGIEVEVIAVGSGKALKLAENGDVDAVLSHAPDLEKAFETAGFGVNRRAVMYNDFVIVGPAGDPARIAAATGAAEAFRRIADARSTFVSRGDDSGTHQKEKALWREAAIEPSGPWYLAAGQGMGEVLQMSDEKRAYTLADRATWLAYRRKGALRVLLEGDGALQNPYSVIAVNPARHPHARYFEAMELVAWLTSVEGQKRIASFSIDGETLFHGARGSAGTKTMRQGDGSGIAVELLRALDGRVLSAVEISLRVSLLATALAALVGIPLGFTVAMRPFRGRAMVELALRTSTALPTVVVGLLAYSFFSHRGALGAFGLLYTPAAIVIAETALAAPLVAALTVAVVGGADRRIEETALTLGASRLRAAFGVLSELRRGLAGAVATAFGRVVSELGIALMVGGNIAGSTRTMTTAIALETSKGEFALGLALGVVLLVVALVVNLAAWILSPR